MPLDWNVGILSDLVDVKYGKDHKKLKDGKIPVYGSGGIMRYVNEKLYDSESVLIPRKGSLGNVIYVNNAFWSVDTMFYTVMKEKNLAKYIYFFIKSKDLVGMNSGSAVPSMTTQILNNIRVKIPRKEELERFEKDVNPMFKQIDINKKQNEILIKLRDTLLPKLMNGKIDLSNISLE